MRVQVCMYCVQACHCYTGINCLELEFLLMELYNIHSSLLTVHVVLYYYGVVKNQRLNSNLHCVDTAMHLQIHVVHNI